MNMLPWIIGIAAAAGALLTMNILGVITSAGSFNLQTFTGFGFVIIFIGGYIFTSRIFNELQSPVKSHFFLTLPARAEEKLISAWLISSLFFITISYLLLSLISFIISGLLVLIFDGTLQVFNPFSIEALKIAAIYLITQTIFLLGSIYFKKNNFLKTILAVFTVFAILFTWGMIMVLIVIKPFQFAQHSGNFEGSLIDAEYVNTIASYMFWYVTGPLFLIVSYFRLKERQV